MKSIILMLPYHNKSIDAPWMLLGKQHTDTQHQEGMNPVLQEYGSLLNVCISVHVCACV